MISQPLMLGLLALGAAFAATAGAASAQVAPQAPVAPVSVATAPQRPLDISLAGAALGLTDAEAEALRKAGVVRTSLDHQFTRDGVVGQVGFLCGLPPNASDGGANAVRGYDPQGRFLGAKLSFAFR